MAGPQGAKDNCYFFVHMLCLYRTIPTLKYCNQNIHLAQNIHRLYDIHKF